MVKGLCEYLFSWVVKVSPNLSCCRILKQQVSCLPMMYFLSNSGAFIGEMNVECLYMALTLALGHF